MEPNAVRRFAFGSSGCEAKVVSICICSGTYQSPAQVRQKWLGLKPLWYWVRDADGKDGIFGIIESSDLGRHLPRVDDSTRMRKFFKVNAGNATAHRTMRVTDQKLSRTLCWSMNMGYKTNADRSFTYILINPSVRLIDQASITSFLPLNNSKQ